MSKLDKAIKETGKFMLENSEKLLQVTITRDATVIPHDAKRQERYDLRLDFDDTVTAEDGTIYNKFQVQPNTEDIPYPIKNWRQAHGGTHRKLGDLYVKERGSQEDVNEGFEQFREAFRAERPIPLPTGNGESSTAKPKTPSRGNTPNTKIAPSQGKSPPKRDEVIFYRIDPMQQLLEVGLRGGVFLFRYRDVSILPLHINSTTLRNQEIECMRA